MESKVLRCFQCVCIAVLLNSVPVKGKFDSHKRSPKTELRNPFIRKQNSKSFENPQDYKINCCQNGGRCIMGAFCQCAKNFYGRYCEYKSENKPCNKVPHGFWAKSGCHLCRCFDGQMDCIPRAYRGCDDQPIDVRDKYNPEDEVYIFTTEPTREDYYDYEDNYIDYHSSASSVCLSGTVVFISMLLTMCCLFWGR